ncbi:MAG: hypothetical protein ACJAXI_001536 [Crocinitomicaceae bacterium]
MISGSSLSASGQTVLFSEDFEASPVTNFLNTWTSETQLPDGPSPCGSSTRGNSADFNSSTVDFNVAQNGSYFLGLNPESPCGGFYNASLHSPTQDFSGLADSIVVSIRYFKSSTLGWGPSQLEIVFDNGTVTDTIRDQFATIDNWDVIDYVLPISMHKAIVDITINIGGGEGVGLDDMTVTRYLVIASTIEIATGLSLFPNPAKDQINIRSKSEHLLSWEIYGMTGNIVLSSNDINSLTENIDLSVLDNGNYIIRIETINGARASQRITKY